MSKVNNDWAMINYYVSSEVDKTKQWVMDNINYVHDIESNNRVVKEMQKNGGGDLWKLAKNLTDKFYSKHKDDIKGWELWDFDKNVVIYLRDNKINTKV